MRQILDPWRGSQLAEVVERAKNLDELLMDELPSGFSSELQLEDAPHLRPWLDAVAAGDRSAFLRRLAWDTTDRLVASPLGSDEADWISWIEEVADQAPLIATEIAGGNKPAEAALFPPEAIPPFFELWLPFLRIAQDRLNHCIGQVTEALLTVRALRDLERQLLADLSVRGAWAAYECFNLLRLQVGVDQKNGHGEHGVHLYNDFIRPHLAGGLSDFFFRFPGLARRLAVAAQRWIEAVAELSHRLAQDAGELAVAFGGGRALGQVIAVERLSEPHGGGRRVMALTLSGGRRLVYKPRSVSCELAFQGILLWLAERGLDCTPTSLQILAREGYGWSPWIEPTAAVDRAAQDRYFERAGALLCLVELLGGTDLHAENVVAAAGGPVLIDAETLLQPLMEEERAGAPARFLSQFVSSPQVDAAGRPHDLGGLQGAVRWLGEERRPIWRAVGTDDVSVDYQAAYVEPGHNVLYWRGRPCMPGAHRDALARGFAATYRFLLRHRDSLLAEEGPLSEFRDVTSRVILRSSQSYASMVARLRFARFQTTGMATDVLIETTARPFVCDHIRPLGWRLIAEERRALREGDIPRFEVCAGDTRIELPGRQKVAGCFSISGLEAARNRIRCLSEPGLAGWLKELPESAGPTEGAAPRQTG